MKRRSLRFRLLAAAAVSISLALVLAGFSLVELFARLDQTRIATELDNHGRQLIAALEMGADQHIRLARELADPRFRQPLSGLYWQIQDHKPPTLLRSRSLWDVIIKLPEDPLSPGVVHQHSLPGPGDSALLVRERQISFQAGGTQRELRVAVAVDEADLRSARDAFAAGMWPYVGVIALFLLSAAWVQVGTGLKPLESLRQAVRAVRSGKAQRLPDNFPEEVNPLIVEMNALLDAQAQAIARARAWTADLAHGLKTPLSALTADAQRLRALGIDDVAEDLEQLAQSMRRRVDRELVRARVRTTTRLQRPRADLVQVLRGVIRTLERTPLGERIVWELHLPQRAEVRILAEDLSELLGNLLENACKWAAATISVRVDPHPAKADSLCVEIRDDGPGVPQAQLANLGERGLRLDELVQGTGLGLAIAGDIADAYGCELKFANATQGGLQITLRLPAPT